MPIKHGDNLTYEGCVLATRERNWPDDSDFYAVVWDDKEKRITEVEYDTTRFAGGGDAWVDATAETKEKAAAYVEWWLYGMLKDSDKSAAHKIEIGKSVTVVRGRKISIGTIGKVFWMGVDNWGVGRIGIKEADGTVHWTAKLNCEVLSPDFYLTDDEEIRERAKRGRNDYTIMSRYSSSRAGMLV